MYSATHERVITLLLGRDKNNSGLLKELIRLQDLLLCPLTKKSFSIVLLGTPLMVIKSTSALLTSQVVKP